MMPPERSNDRAETASRRWREQLSSPAASVRHDAPEYAGFRKAPSHRTGTGRQGREGPDVNDVESAAVRREADVDRMFRAAGEHMAERAFWSERLWPCSEERLHLASGDVDPHYLVAGRQYARRGDRRTRAEFAQEHFALMPEPAASTEIEFRHAGMLRTREERLFDRRMRRHQKLWSRPAR